MKDCEKIPRETLPCERADGEYIEKSIDAYTDSIFPPDEDAPEEEFQVFKVVEGGRIIGGCLASIDPWCAIEIEVLWVDEAYRGQGIGSMLLREAERCAKEKGCYLATLGTFDFQARGLYEKHGYTVYAVGEDCPRGHLHYALFKRLDEEIPDYIPSHNSAPDRFTVERGTEEDAEFIDDSLVAFNRSVVPAKHDYLKINRKLVDADGRMIAGIIAGVGGWDDGFIRMVWVEEPYRRRGLGSYLLHEAEREAKEAGAEFLLVVAADWNLGFFGKQGYEITGILEDLPRGHCCYELKKRI